MRGLGYVWAVFASLLLASEISAQSLRTAPDRVHILLGTYHAVPARTSFAYEETNPGLILTWDQAWRGLDVSAGLFENSFSDTSPLLAIGKTWTLEHEIQGRALVALARYEEEDPIFQPLRNGWVLIPSLQISYRQVFAQVTPLPEPDNTGLIFAYGLEFEF